MVVSVSRIACRISSADTPAAWAVRTAEWTTALRLGGRGDGHFRNAPRSFVQVDPLHDKPLPVAQNVSRRRGKTSADFESMREVWISFVYLGMFAAILQLFSRGFQISFCRLAWMTVSRRLRVPSFRPALLM